MKIINLEIINLLKMIMIISKVNYKIHIKIKYTAISN